MTALRRIVLLRHGNTVGNSHARFHGSSDIALSDEGRDQVRAAGQALATEVFELIAASPLRRSWESAALLSGGAAVRLVPEFREIHFGRWEGLTAEEIQERDPSLYAAWQEKGSDFEFPGGEPRAEFRERVIAGFDQIAASGARGALLVVHKGVIRTIGEHLAGEPISDGPELGAAISLSRVGDQWLFGRRSSNPPALRDAAA
jgi:broad specificity phosphatase PhoE